MTNQYTAIDIANYILWYAQKKTPPISITALKLQKLLYYVVTTHYQENDALLYEENIEKWEFGPVTPSVYHTFKSWPHGASLSPTVSIKKIEHELKIQDYDPETIKDECIKKSIKKVIDKIGDYSASDLVEITHQEDAWKRDKEIILNTWNNPIYKKEDLLAATPLDKL